MEDSQQKRSLPTNGYRSFPEYIKYVSEYCPSEVLIAVGKTGLPEEFNAPKGWAFEEFNMDFSYDFLFSKFRNKTVPHGHPSYTFGILPLVHIFGDTLTKFRDTDYHRKLFVLVCMLGYLLRDNELMPFGAYWTTSELSKDIQVVPATRKNIERINFVRNGPGIEPEKCVYLDSFQQLKDLL